MYTWHNVYSVVKWEVGFYYFIGLCETQITIKYNVV